MGWNYKSMTRLACFVPQAGMDKWERRDVEFMVEEFGLDRDWETKHASLVMLL